jgi:hypothetical protein
LFDEPDAPVSPITTSLAKVVTKIETEKAPLTGKLPLFPDCE